MSPDDQTLDAVTASVDAARGLPPDAALPFLRDAAEQLTTVIDETLAEAVLGSASLRAAGAQAGLSENAVGPRLARTRSLGGYANDAGRVTAAGVERAKYDQETGTPPPPAPAAAAPMRFKPRRPTTPRSSP